MRHLEKNLSHSALGSVLGNRKGHSVHVKKQYSQAKAAFKGIHRMTSLAFEPVDPAPKVDKSQSCD